MLAKVIIIQKSKIAIRNFMLSFWQSISSKLPKHSVLPSHTVAQIVTLVSKEAQEKPYDRPKLRAFVELLMNGLTHLSVPHFDGNSSDSSSQL